MCSSSNKSGILFGMNNLFIYNIKCFKKCGCSSYSRCNYCNSDYFIGYDLFNNNTNPRYKLMNALQAAPNTNGFTCTSSNVEIQVNKFKRLINYKRTTLNNLIKVFWHVWMYEWHMQKLQFILFSWL